MNAESELLRAYREWRRLALAETKAIQTRNWRLLADCHLVIRDYQSLVSTLTRAPRTEWQSAGCDLAQKEANLKIMVSDLMEITRNNHVLLQAARGRVSRQLDELGAVGGNLKRIGRAYGQIAAGRLV